MAAYRRVYDSRHLTPKTRDQLRNPTLGVPLPLPFTLQYALFYILKGRSHIRCALLRCADKTLPVFLLALCSNLQRICERPLILGSVFTDCAIFLKPDLAGRPRAHLSCGSLDGRL